MTILELVERYLQAKYAAGYSELTLKNRKSHLRRFVEYLKGYDITDAATLTREDIEAYMEELSFTPTRSSKTMAPTTRNVRLASIRSFCGWLTDTDVLPIDPSEKVESCREPDPLPKNVPTEDEMKQLLAAPDPQTTLGFRDRLMLELLYSTAIRLRELCALNVDDLDLQQGFAIVRHGKGDKGRVVPVGKLAVELLQSYLGDIRPRLLAGLVGKGGDKDEQALILSRYGKRLGPRGVEKIISRTAKQARLKGHVTPHSFRHACATHMLRGGANIRHLQEMLGHKKLTTTEIYTRVSIGELKEVHARFHPRGNVDEPEVRKPRRPKGESNDDDNNE